MKNITGKSIRKSNKKLRGNAAANELAQSLSCSGSINQSMMISFA